MKKLYIFLLLVSYMWALDAEPSKELKTYAIIVHNYVLDSLGRDISDPSVMFDRASRWLESVGPETKLDAKVIKYHNALMHGSQLIKSPTCGPDESNILEALKELQDFRVNYREYMLTEIIVNFIIKERGKKCGPNLKSKIIQYINELDPSYKSALLSIADKTGEKRGHDTNLVGGAYNSIVTHIEDPLIAFVLPSNTKSLSSKQYDSIYDKYVVEPCKKFLDDTIAYRDELKFVSIDYRERIIGPLSEFDAITKACANVLDDSFRLFTADLDLTTNKKKVSLHEAVKMMIESKTGRKISSSLFAL